MSIGQAKLVKWSLPALALILGLFWYKRRRVDRVDPGGSSNQKAAMIADEGASKKTLVVDQSPMTNVPQNETAAKRCDSGVNSNESHNTNGLIPNKDQQQKIANVTPRKVSISLDIPGRSNVPPPEPIFSSTPWYEDVEEEEEMNKVQDTKKRSPIELLGSQPAKEHSDLLSKSHSSAELLATGEAMKENQIEQERQIKQAKVVVANGTPKIQEFFPKKLAKYQEMQAAAKAEAQKSEEAVNNDQLTNGDAASGVERKQESQNSMERDSANHSPVSGVLDGSVTDEARSEGEGSTDSGKGGSINGARNKDINRTFYDFSIPANLVGRLIGKGGRFLEQIRNKANVGVVVKRHPSNDDEHRICSIDGTPENIQKALGIIRKHFPDRVYPFLTLEQIVYEELVVPEEMSYLPEPIQLYLIEGVNNDVVISQIDKPNHFYVHLHTHPSFQSLPILNDSMTNIYDNAPDCPPLPEPLYETMMAAGKVVNRWHRVAIVKPDPKGVENLVRLVDYGNLWKLKNSDMKQLRTDFMSVPLQAIEVYLDIEPKDGKWTQQAYDIVSHLSANRVGQAQVKGYTHLGKQVINLWFNVPRVGYIPLAEELIARGLAVPLVKVPPAPVPSALNLEEVVPQEAQPAV